ncbi:MAG: efflux RND transporter periplasmic adaptor subunit, partial [Spirochaetia bacterium]|nr:efflux RND transporter periplasmic adaptor subunit [Spirochaetia bacterium]
MKITKLIIVCIILLTLIISGCSNSTGESTAASESSDATPVAASLSASAGAIIVDLASPPPGSNADQAKWETFDAAKKQESWDKYVSDNTPAEGEVQTADPVEVAEEKKPGSGGGSSIVPVVVGELTKAPMNIFYYGLGELAAGDEIRVTPGSTGTVATLYISEGDFVESGDLLFSLDNNDLVKNIERTSEKWDKDLELTAIKLNEARDNYETTSSLYSKELISKSEYDKAKQTWEEAELNYEKTQIAKTTEIGNLQENLRTTLAISPGRGYISGITFRRGELVNSADYVEIIDIEKIEVRILVPGNIISRIKKGQRVVAKKASAPEYILEGLVSLVGLKADSNRTYEVIAEFDNQNQKLLPGMLIEAQ